jgi:hypothetical protein
MSDTTNSLPLAFVFAGELNENVKEVNDHLEIVVKAANEPLMEFDELKLFLARPSNEELNRYEGDEEEDEKTGEEIKQDEKEGDEEAFDGIVREILEQIVDCVVRGVEEEAEITKAFKMLEMKFEFWTPDGVEDCFPYLQSGARQESVASTNSASRPVAALPSRSEWVTLKQEQTAHAAWANRNADQFDDMMAALLTTSQAGPALPSPQNPTCKRLFMGNLSAWMDEGWIRDMLAWEVNDVGVLVRAVRDRGRYVLSLWDVLLREASLI